MTRSRAVGRREFTLASVLAALGGATITVASCGGGGSPSSASPAPAAGGGGREGTVSANHGHSAVIAAAELAAANAVNLAIRGAADHPHTVSLTAADVAGIAAGQRVSRTSTAEEGHTHVVTFN
jgi:hypothetical protein